MGKLKEISKNIVAFPESVGWAISTMFGLVKFMYETEQTMEELGTTWDEGQFDEVVKAYINYKINRFNDRLINKYFDISLDPYDKE